MNGKYNSSENKGYDLGKTIVRAGVGSLAGCIIGGILFGPAGAAVGSKIGAIAAGTNNPTESSGDSFDF